MKKHRPGKVKGLNVHRSCESDLHWTIFILSGSAHRCSEPWVRKSNWAFPALIWLDIISVCVLHLVSPSLPLPLGTLSWWFQSDHLPSNSDASLEDSMYHSSSKLASNLRQNLWRCMRIFLSLLFADSLYGKEKQLWKSLPTNCFIYQREYKVSTTHWPAPPSFIRFPRTQW